MKITIEFDNREEAETALKASDYVSAICDADNYCRGILKHVDCSEETAKHLERIRELLRDNE